MGNGEKKQKNWFTRFLAWIEKWGNKLPDPVTLFVILSGIILIASALGAAIGLSAVNPATGDKIAVVNLLSGDGIRKILTEFVGVFATFPPLGFVLVIMFGIGLAESTGLLTSLMKVTIMRSPKVLIVPTIVFIGMMGNVAGDAAFMIIPPIAAMIFYSVGRHPLAGLALGYASVAGGFTANLLINTTDVVLVGFTQEAASLIDSTYVANPAMNYYFITASFFLLIPVAIFVNNKIVEPHLGKYTGITDEPDKLDDVTAEDKRGLIAAGFSLLLFIVVLLLAVLPENAILRNQETGAIIEGSPFMASLVPLTMLLFLIPSIVYGIVSRQFKSDKDLVLHFSKAMSGMGTFIVFAFVASQMIAYFNWSNLGQVLAIKSASFLTAIGFEGLPLIVSLVLVVALINFMISSNAGKWALLAPVFIPMFMILNIDPALTQVAYRIGDSITNPITPMMAYFVITLTFAKRYEPKIEIGRFMSVLLPYSISFGVAWIVFLVIWYLIGIPVGPGYDVFLN